MPRKDSCTKLVQWKKPLREDDTVWRKEMRWLGSRGQWVNADLLSRASALELNGSGHAGEEGMVFAETDVETGEKLGPALAHDDGPSLDGFAAIRFDSQILRIAVSSISR